MTNIELLERLLREDVPLASDDRASNALVGILTCTTYTAGSGQSFTLSEVELLRFAQRIYRFAYRLGYQNGEHDSWTQD